MYKDNQRIAEQVHRQFFFISLIKLMYIDNDSDDNDDYRDNVDIDILNWYKTGIQNILYLCTQKHEISQNKMRYENNKLYL